jgi:hypothetical protein
MGRPTAERSKVTIDGASTKYKCGGARLSDFRTPPKVCEGLCFHSQTVLTFIKASRVIRNDQDVGYDRKRLPLTTYHVTTKLAESVSNTDYEGRILKSVIFQLWQSTYGCMPLLIARIGRIDK